MHLLRRAVLALALVASAHRHHRGHRRTRRRAQQRPRQHAADGLERLERVRLQRQRAARRADRRRHGQFRHEGRRLPVRQHRRLLDVVVPQLDRPPGAGSDQVPGRHLRRRRPTCTARPQARHLRERRHRDLRRLPGQPQPRDRPTPTTSPPGASTTSSTTTATTRASTGRSGTTRCGTRSPRPAGRSSTASANGARTASGPGAPAPATCGAPPATSTRPIGSMLSIFHTNVGLSQLRRPGRLERPGHARGRQRHVVHRGPGRDQPVGRDGRAADLRHRPALGDPGDAVALQERRRDRGRPGLARQAGARGLLLAAASTC